MRNRNDVCAVHYAENNIKVWHRHLSAQHPDPVYGLMFSAVAGGFLMGRRVSGLKRLWWRLFRWACSAFRCVLHPASGFDKNSVPPCSYLCDVYASGSWSGIIRLWSVRSFVRRAVSPAPSGFCQVQPVFWTFPPQLLSGPAQLPASGSGTTMGHSVLSSHRLSV